MDDGGGDSAAVVPDPKGEGVAEDFVSGGTIITESDPNWHKYKQVLAEFQCNLEKEMRRASQARHMLNDAEMMRTSNQSVRLEGHFKKANAFFFSIDCLLDLKPLTGALYRGQCILVFAGTHRQATEYASEGLQSALQELRAYYFTHVNDTINAGLATFVAGRKGDASMHEPLAHDAKTRELLINRFGRRTH